MARARKLRVEITAKAWRDLDSIWEWTAKAFSVSQADRYIGFLINESEKLDSRHSLGRPVATRGTVRSISARRKGSKGGHVLVYEADENVVRVLHIFHSAQEWPSILAGED